LVCASDNDIEPRLEGLFERMLRDNEIDSVARSTANGGVCPQCGGHLVRYVIHTDAGHIAFDACQFASSNPARCDYGRIGLGERKRG
jgi:hypothetical protein